MSIKVELSFNSNAGAGPFFQIGDPLRGVIGGEYVIGGENVFVDISQELRSLSISRGKSRELNRYEAGQISLSFNNNNRWFDPTYSPSPYFGQIVPRREIRVSIDDVLSFVGIVEDWSLAYDPSGVSVASCVAIDAYANLAGLSLTDFLPNVELSGARVNGALDNVGWSADLRDIDAGQQSLEEQIIVGPTPILEYLATVEQSEPGSIFIDKSGQVKFVDRSGGYVESEVSLNDDGTGIPYTNLSVIYGSELLYNKITLTNELDEALAEDADSQDAYGERELIQATFIENLTDLERTANYLLGRYKEPEFRFSNLVVNLNALTNEQKQNILDLELGDIIQIGFTPSGLAPQIVQGARIINIQHRADPRIHEVTFGFESLTGSPFIIGSANFGIIGVGTIGF